MSAPLPKLEYVYTDHWFAKAEDVVDEFGISTQAIAIPTPKSVHALLDEIEKRLKFVDTNYDDMGQLDLQDLLKQLREVRQQ